MFVEFKNNNDFPRVVTLIVPTTIYQISSKKWLQMNSLFYYHPACFNLIKSSYKRLKLEIWLVFFGNVLRYGKIAWRLCVTQETSGSLTFQLGNNVQVSLVVDIPLNPLRGTTSSSKGVSMNTLVSTKRGQRSSKIVFWLYTNFGLLIVVSLFYGFFLLWTMGIFPIVIKCNN